MIRSGEVFRGLPCPIEQKFFVLRQRIKKEEEEAGRRIQAMVGEVVEPHKDLLPSSILLEIRSPESVESCEWSVTDYLPGENQICERRVVLPPGLDSSFVSVVPAVSQSVLPVTSWIERGEVIAQSVRNQLLMAAMGIGKSPSVFEGYTL